MKIAFITFLISFSALAKDCFIRRTELASKEVAIAREVCILSIEVKLDYYGGSEARIHYGLDGVLNERTIKLDSSTVIFNLDHDSVGGWCSNMVEADITAKLVINKLGTEATITSVQGIVSMTNDNCHSEMSEIQSFPFYKSHSL